MLRGTREHHPPQGPGTWLLRVGAGTEPAPDPGSCVVTTAAAQVTSLCQAVTEKTPEMKGFITPPLKSIQRPSQKGRDRRGRALRNASRMTPDRRGRVKTNTELSPARTWLNLETEEKFLQGAPEGPGPAGALVLDFQHPEP